MWVCAMRAKAALGCTGSVVPVGEGDGAVRGEAADRGVAEERGGLGGGLGRARGGAPDAAEAAQRGGHRGVGHADVEARHVRQAVGGQQPRDGRQFEALRQERAEALLRGERADFGGGAFHAVHPSRNASAPQPR